MFDWFFNARDGTRQSAIELIKVDVKRLQISKMALEKAVGMIAKAIAKSEFVVQRKSGREKDHIYYILNVRPNANETATDFWMKAVRKMLTESECLICLISGNLYIADGFSCNDSVLLPQIYRDVKITSNEESLHLRRTFTANEVLHLKARNKKIQAYLKKIISLYDDTVSAMCAVKKLTSTPKFALEMDGMQMIRKKNPDGTEKQLTSDEYKDGVKRLLESDDIEIITNSTGLVTKQLKIETDVSSEDIVKISKEIFTETALAFDIPKAVFLGEITEKADSTNEFITYAVSWVAEVLNDSMNAKFVGESDFLKGERIWVDLSKYKHIDTIESAANLDKLRSIGFNFDEIRDMVGLEQLNTEFSRERVITKNYTNDLGGKGEEK